MTELAGQPVEYYEPDLEGMPLVGEGPKPGDVPPWGGIVAAQHALRAALPTAGGVAAIPAGAAIGSLGGPFSPVTVPLGGLAAAFGAGALIEHFQGEALEAHPQFAASLGIDDATLATGAAAHPWWAMGGQLAPQAAFFRPGALSWKGVALGGGVGAGVAGGMELAQTGSISPSNVISQGVLGAVLHKPTRLGELTMGGWLSSIVPAGRGTTVPRAAANDVTAAGAADFGISEAAVAARAAVIAVTHPHLSPATLESYARAELFHEAAGANATPDEQAAGTVIESDTHAEATNPYAGPGAGLEHGAKLTAATEALANDEPVPDLSRPINPIDRDSTIGFVVDHLEGGFTVDSGGPTKFGISGDAHPGLAIKDLNRADALRIYRTEYWNPMQLEELDPRLAAVAFDAAVNHGVRPARRMLAESGGDPVKLIELRRAEYARLIAENPEKFGRYADGWNNRLAKLAAFVGEPVPALRPDLVVSDPDEPELTVEDYVDRHLAGEGRGDSIADLELRQFGANNAAAIEAELTRRAGLSPAETPAAEAGGFDAETPTTPLPGAGAATEGQFDPLPHIPALRDYVKSYRGSLEPAAIAKQLGLTPEQAERVISRLLASPNSGVTAAFKKVAVLDAEGKPVFRRGRPVMQRVQTGLRRLPARRGSIDLFTFLKDKGGLRDDEGHDLFKGRGLGQVVGLIRKSGLSVDAAGQLLHEARYFLERPTEDEVLQLLERATREKVYPLHEQEEADYTRRSEEMDESEQQARSDIAAAIEHVGTLNETEMVEALRHMARGLDPENAAMAAIENSDLGVAEALAIETDDPGYDIADFEERYDRPAPEGWIPADEPDRGAAAAPGEGSARPGGDAGDAGGGLESRPPAAQDFGPPKDLDPYSEPAGPGADAQADALEHDIRMDVETATPSTTEGWRAWEAAQEAVARAIDGLAMRQGVELTGDFSDQQIDRLAQIAMAGGDVDKAVAALIKDDPSLVESHGEPASVEPKPLPPSGVVPTPARTVNISKIAGDFIPPEEARARLAGWKAEAKRIGKSGVHKGQVILSFFDASGIMSQPYRDMGYEVHQLDLKHGDDVIEDLLEHLTLVDQLRAEGKDIAGVLAQPPCTTFASSGARWWEPRHNRAWSNAVTKMFGERAAKLFETPVEYNQYLVATTENLIAHADPTFFVIENPNGRIERMTGLPKPLVTFDPNNFGDPYTKRTNLWGKFNPKLETANVEPVEGSRMHKLRSTAEKEGGLRSQTSEPFAYSFALANHPEPRATGATLPVPPEVDAAVQEHTRLKALPPTDEIEARMAELEGQVEDMGIAYRDQVAALRRGGELPAVELRAAAEPTVEMSAPEMFEAIRHLPDDATSEDAIAAIRSRLWEEEDAAGRLHEPNSAIERFDQAREHWAEQFAESRAAGSEAELAGMRARTLEQAQRIFDAVKGGATVRSANALSITELTRAALDQGLIRVHDGTLQILRGRQGWISFTGDEVAAMAQRLAPGRLLDLGEAVDPAIAELQRQQVQLGAEAPQRVPVEQEGTMGLAMFDAAHQPEFRLSEEGEPTTIQAVLEGIEADRQALDDLSGCYQGGGAA